MKWKKIEDGYLLKPDVGEEVVGAIKDLVVEQGFQSGSVCGIGGIEAVVLGYYDLDTKTYHKKELSGRYELVSLVGAILGEAMRGGSVRVVATQRSGVVMGCALPRWLDL